MAARQIDLVELEKLGYLRDRCLEHVEEWRRFAARIESMGLTVAADAIRLTADSLEITLDVLGYTKRPPVGETGDRAS